MRILMSEEHPHPANAEKEFAGCPSRPLSDFYWLWSRALQGLSGVGHCKDFSAVGHCRDALGWARILWVGHYKVFSRFFFEVDHCRDFLGLGMGVGNSGILWEWAPGDRPDEE